MTLLETGLVLPLELDSHTNTEQLRRSNDDYSNNSNNNADLRRITSCFFSVKSALSEDDEDACFTDTEGLIYDSLVDASASVRDEELELGDEVTVRTSASCPSCPNVVNIVDELYHEVMFNVFSYLSANDLVSFSETAR